MKVMIRFLFLFCISFMVSAEERVITFLGDLSFGESYQDVLKARGRGNILQIEGYEYSIENFRDILINSDFVAANLETPITDFPYSELAGKKKYIHYGDVDLTFRMLSKYNIGLVSLANNHSMDYGYEGLKQTVELANKSNIESCGHGKDFNESAKPYVHDFTYSEKVLKLIVFCAYEYNKKYNDFLFYSAPEKGGVYSLDSARLISDVRRYKDKSDAFVVAYLHWGDNYKSVDEGQLKMARELVRAGADLVVGHGAHMIQKVERYNGKWIIYNLGNFVFNSPGRYAKEGVFPYGFILNMVLKDGGYMLRLYPVFTDNRITRYKSRFLNDHEFSEVESFVRATGDFSGEYYDLLSSGKDIYGMYLELKGETKIGR